MILPEVDDMKRSNKQVFPLFIISAGMLGLCLRFWLFSAGIDEKGLIRSGHPANYILPVLSAAVLVALFFYTRNTGNPTDYQQLFPRSVICAIGNWAAGAGILYFGIHRFLVSAGTAYLLLLATGIIVVCFAILGYFRLKGLRPSCLLHAFITIFFIGFLLLQYSGWSANPQLGKYCYEALACVFLTLAFYYRATLDAELQGLRRYLLFHLAALFFCCLSLTSQDRLFYLAMFLHSAVELCSLSIPSKKKRKIMALPEPVLSCIQKLELAGFQAYAVGGCVRDSLLGIVPQDYDLCTDARPEDICRVFSDCRLVRSGEKHGTIGVVLENGVCEITTFRTEGTYTDNRHPDSVTFVTTVEEDLRRRDFTVNAMAYSPASGYIDPWMGQLDLEHQRLRAVGDPYTRFREDALRILRGVRFSIRFRLTPEPRTEQAMRELSPLMDKLARERIFDELCKLLPLANAADLQRFAPILIQVIPELAPAFGFAQNSPHHRYDVFTHTAHVVEAVPKTLALRWAALLHDIGKPATYTEDENGHGHFYDHAKVSAEMANTILLRLKAPNALREQVVFLIAHHMTRLEPDRKLLLRRLGKYGEDNLRLLLALQKADHCSKGTVQTDIAIFSETEALLTQLLRQTHCLSTKDLAINGTDILSLGVAPGPLVGACMSALLAGVQEESLPNTKEALLEAARSFLQSKQS